MKKKLVILIGLTIQILVFSANSFGVDYTEWNLPPGAKMRFGKGEIYDIKFSSDGNLLAVGSSIGIWIYDVQSQEPLEFLKSQSLPIYTIGFTNDSNNIISASEFGRIFLWDIDTSKTSKSPDPPKLHRMLGATGYIWSSAISNDGNTLATGNGSGSISLWDLQTGNRLSTFKAHLKSVDGLAFSLDGKTLASGSTDSKIHLWNVSTLKRESTLTESFGAHALAFTSDGKSLVSGSFGGSLQSWNLETKQKMISFKGHADRIRAVSISPDKKILAAGSWDGTIRLWNAETGKHFGIIYGHPPFVENMALAPDSNTVAGSARGSIRLWDKNTRRKRPTIINTIVWTVLRFLKTKSRKEVILSKYYQNLKGYYNETSFPLRYHVIRISVGLQV